VSREAGGVDAAHVWRQLLERCPDGGRPPYLDTTAEKAV
jgi:hypothetical protein